MYYSKLNDTFQIENLEFKEGILKHKIESYV